MSVTIVQGNLAFLAMLLFLAMTLAIGYYFSKQKITFREYAVGNKRFATATLVATVMATNWSGGGLIRTVQKVHQLGWYWILIMFGGGIVGYWIVSRLAVRMGPFMEHFSIAETIGNVYGKMPRVVTALSSILNCIGSIAIQIVVMANAIQMCTGTTAHSQSMALVATGILILYSAFGGIRSVTFTDVFQFATFGLIIPCVLWFVFLQVGKPVPDIAAALAAHERFQLGKLFDWNTNLFSMLALFLAFIFEFDPPTMQRVYMASGPLQAKQTFRYVIAIDALLLALITLIGLCVFAGSPDLAEDQIWPYILNSVPPVVKIGVAVSLLAMTMSTADSNLNACSVMVAHDIVASFPGSAHRVRTGFDKVKVARITTVAVGTLAMLLASVQSDLLELLKVSLDYYLPIVTAPYLLAIYGFRSSSRTALIGMGAGIASMLLWNLFVEPRTGIDGAFFCMGINCLAMLLAHYRMKQPEGSGWVEPDKHYWQIRHTEERRFARFGHRIEHFFGLANPEALAKARPTSLQLFATYVYCLTTTLLSGVLHAQGAPILQSAYARHMAVAFLFLFASVWDRPPVYQKLPKFAAWKGFFWIVGLTYTLLVNMGWHWKHATVPGFAICLSFANLAVLFLLVPFYTACYLSVIVSAVYLCNLLLVEQPVFQFSLQEWLLVWCGGVTLSVIVWQKKKIRIYQDSEERMIQEAEHRAAQEEIRYQHSREMALRTIGTPDVGKMYKIATARMQRRFVRFLEREPSEAKRTEWVGNFVHGLGTYLTQYLRLSELYRIHPTEIDFYPEAISAAEQSLEGILKYRPRLYWERVVVSRPQDPRLPEYEIPRIQMPRYMFADAACIKQLMMAAIRFVTDERSAVHPSEQFIRIEAHPVKLRNQKSALSNSKIRPQEGQVHDADTPLYEAVAFWVGNETLQTKRPNIQSIYFATDSTQPSDEWFKGSYLERYMRALVDSHHGFLWCHPPAKDQSAADVNDDDPTKLRLIPVEHSVLIVLPMDVRELADQYGDRYTYLVPPTRTQKKQIKRARKAFAACLNSLAPELDRKRIGSALRQIERSYCGKIHDSGVLFLVRTLKISEMAIREWKAQPALFAAALGPQESCSTDFVVASLLYALHKQSFVTLEYLRTISEDGVYAIVDATASIESKLLFPGFTPKDKGLFEQYKQENRLMALYLKETEWYYDMTNAKGYSDRNLLKKRIDQARDFKIPLALHYFQGTTVAKYFQDKAIAAVMHAFEPPVKGPSEADRKPDGAFQGNQAESCVGVLTKPNKLA